MIEFVDQINQPNSGAFEERIYDNQSAWNSQSWTFIKFTNDDFYEWCGVFRGRPGNAEISKTRKEILILTSDYLWKLDANNGEVIEFEDQPQYQNLTVAPNGVFLLADYYNISRIDGTLNNSIDITSPIQLDLIKFKNWEGEKLIIECIEFMNWKRHLTLELDSSNWRIKIRKPNDNI